MIGTAPEEIHEWASGFSPFSEEPNLGNRLDPRIKPGREQGLLDVATLVPEAAGLGIAGLRRGARAAYPTLNPEVNMSRREFMGNTGKIAAGLAAASVVPDVLHHVAPSAATRAVAAAARGVAQGGVAHADYQVLKNLAILRAKNAQRAALEASPDKFGTSPEIQNVYEETLENEMRKIKEHPQFKNFENIDDIHTREAEELNALKNNYNELSDLKDVPKDYRSFDRTWLKSGRYDNSFDKLRRASEDYRLRSDEIKAKYDNLIAEYNAKHGYLSADEVYERMKTDPDFKYIDPYNNREYAWVKGDDYTRVPYDPKYDPKIQVLNSNRGPDAWRNDILRGYIDPETGKGHLGSGDAYDGPKSEQYYLDYLKNRGIAPDGSSTTSLPDNYRAGGRVRMI
jgi:hypothetical protein